MEIRTIKNIDEETWREFKLMAVKAGVNMSILFKMMVMEFEKSRKFWNELINGKKIISDKDASEMLEIIKKTRKDGGFRNDLSF